MAHNAGLRLVDIFQKHWISYNEINIDNALSKHFTIGEYNMCL